MLYHAKQSTMVASVRFEKITRRELCCAECTNVYLARVSSFVRLAHTLLIALQKLRR